jgi:hypothetical protein
MNEIAFNVAESMSFVNRQMVSVKDMVDRKLDESDNNSLRSMSLDLYLIKGHIENLNARPARVSFN